MNSIITLKRLVELLSKQANITPERADLFVKAFTSVVRDALIAGEEITIAGVGTFSVAPDAKIKYVPEKELAEAVNAPFAMFQSVELAPGFTTDQIDENFSHANPIHEHKESTTSETHTEEQQPATQAPAVKDDEETQPIHQEPKADKKEQVLFENQLIAEVQPTPTEEQSAVKEQNTPAEEQSAVEEQPTTEKQPVKPVALNMERPCPTEGPVLPTPVPAPKPQNQAPTPSTPNIHSNQHPQMASNIPDTKPAAPVAPKIEYRANGASGNTSFDDDNKPHSPTMLIIWGLIVGLLLGFAAGFFLHDPVINAMMPNEEETAVTDSLEAEQPAIVDPLTDEQMPEPKVEGDSLDTTTATIVEETDETDEAKNEVKANNETKEMYDTIRSGNSLGAIARKHYGNTVYWVYIYLENQDKITNPNRVASGTALRIPPLSKYATKATEEENKAEAQKKVNEVLSKYPQ